MINCVNNHRRSAMAQIAMNEKRKDLSIETLRGLAILLVVAGYIIQHDITRAAHHSLFASGLRFFYYFLTPIRMPLFTVISAFLYAASPATRDTFKKLVTGKARRIMIPFLAVSTIQYVIFSLLPMSNHPSLQEIYKVYIWPHEQLWFLYSIFEIFIIVGVLDAFKFLDTPRKWGLCLALSLVLNIFFQPTKAFSIYGVNYLMPFFILGYGVRRYSELLFCRRAVAIYAVVASAAVVFWSFLYVKPFLPGLAHKVVGLIVTFSAVPLLFHYRRSVPFLAKIGYYAFGIHLFNRIAVSATRAAFEHFNFHNAAIQFATYMVLGIALAIGIQLILERYSLTRTFILGLKDDKKTVAAPMVQTVPVFTFPSLYRPNPTRELARQSTAASGTWGAE